MIKLNDKTLSKMCYFFFFSDPSNPSEQFVSFFIVGKAMPADMTVSVSANYMSASGQIQFNTLCNDHNV